MIIDSHQHVILPTKNQLAMMDNAGIDKTILFATSVHPEKAQNLASFENELKILQNIISGNASSEKDRYLKSTTELVEVVKNHPEKFIGFGPVPLCLSFEETSDWIESHIINNNFKGLGEFTLAPGQIYKLDNIFKLSSAFGNLPLWIHTFNPLTLDDIKQLGILAKKHSNVPVVFGHLGGFNWLTAIHIAKELSNVYLDLSATFSTVQQIFCIKELPEKTFFSSDAPYGEPLLAIESIRYLIKDNYLRELVLGGNIAKLLKL
ncbi:MAG: amidohydrolase family protein [Bacillota bacterium]|nr:amidohydrolase family protein [Bacillota bacterium]